MRLVCLASVAALALAGCLDGADSHIGKPAKIGASSGAGTQWTAQLGRASVQIDTPPLPTVACVIATERTVSCVVGSSFTASGGSLTSPSVVTLEVAGVDEPMDCEADLGARCSVASERIEEFTLDATAPGRDAEFFAWGKTSETRVGGDQAEAEADRTVHVRAHFDERGRAIPADAD